MIKVKYIHVDPSLPDQLPESVLYEGAILEDAHSRWWRIVRVIHHFDHIYAHEMTEKPQGISYARATVKLEPLWEI